MAKKVTFLNASPTDFQMVRYEEYLDQLGEWHETLEDMVNEGYKVSVGHDVDSGGYSFHITDKTSAKTNSGMVMGSWGGSIEGAYRKVMLVFSIALDRELSWQQATETLKAEAEADYREMIEIFQKKRS